MENTGEMAKDGVCSLRILRIAGVKDEERALGKELNVTTLGRNEPGL